MSYYNGNRFPEYVSVRQRQARAASYVAKQKKKGKLLRPILPISGTQIAKTFWGKAWCTHLEDHADIYNRLSRGRSYVRHGAVIDLLIEPGQALAQVMGSVVYNVKITIKPLQAQRWTSIVKRCHGQIDSLVDLLQGQLSPTVMRLLTEAESGVLPKASEIKFTCSCPDYAAMCKHVSAVLYAIGARLDTEQGELFVLRQVDHTELVQQATRGAAYLECADTSGLADTDLSGLFDIDMADEEATAPSSGIKSRQKERKAPVAKPGRKRTPTASRSKKKAAARP